MAPGDTVCAKDGRKLVGKVMEIREYEPPYLTYVAVNWEKDPEDMRRWFPKRDIKPLPVANRLD